MAASVDDALEIIGFGRAQVFLLLNAGLMQIQAVAEAMGMSIIALVSQIDFPMTNQKRSVLTSAAFLGMIVSSFYMGYKSDKIGRRRLLLCTVPTGSLCSVCSAFMPNFWLFVFCRFITGFFLLTLGTTNMTYLSEFSTDSHRGRVVSTLCIFAALGTIYVPSLASVILPSNLCLEISDFILHSWRFLMLCYTCPCLFTITTMYFLPESPKFLQSVGSNEEAYKVLNLLCKWNRRQNLASFGITEITTTSAVPKHPENVCIFRRIWRETVPLMRPPILKKFAICAFIMFTLFETGNSLAMWFPELRRKVKPDDNRTLCEIAVSRGEVSKLTQTSDAIVSYTEPILVGVLNLIMCIFLNLLLVCLRRNWVLFIYLIAAVMCGFTLNFLHKQLLITVFFIFLIILPQNTIVLTSSVIVDNVPTYWRGKAVNLCYMFGRLGVIVGSGIIGLLMDGYCLFVINGFVTLTAISAMLTWLLPK